MRLWRTVSEVGVKPESSAAMKLPKLSVSSEFMSVESSISQATGRVPASTSVPVFHDCAAEGGVIHRASAMMATAANINSAPVMESMSGASLVINVCATYPTVICRDVHIVLLTTAGHSCEPAFIAKMPTTITKNNRAKHAVTFRGAALICSAGCSTTRPVITRRNKPKPSCTATENAMTVPGIVCDFLEAMKEVPLAEPDASASKYPSHGTPPSMCLRPRSASGLDIMKAPVMLQTKAAMCGRRKGSPRKARPNTAATTTLMLLSALASPSGAPTWIASMASTKLSAPKKPRNETHFRSDTFSLERSPLM
mmetsp:Transcript_51453/g.132761  ORF Transcript_51453/g.132761 Transcript_51453/m.132761 type:complete len:311 (-) Transcript_51453:244-1176(-)